MEMLIGLIAVIMIFGIPLSAIIGSFVIKARKLRLEGGGGDVARRLAQLESDNADLRRRVEVLEDIATSDEAVRDVRRVRVAAAEPTAPRDVETRDAETRGGEGAAAKVAARRTT